MSRKYLILLLLISFLCFGNVQVCSSQTKAENNKDNGRTDFIEKRFPWGIQGFNDFISRNLQYPPTAIADSIKGTVYIKFFVNSSGYLSDVMIEKGIRDDIDNECIRVVKLMRWNPQSTSEMPVRVEINLPIKFDLSNQPEEYNLEYLLTPNPANQGFILRIFNSNQEYQYELQDKIGKVIKSGFIITGETVRVNTSDLSEDKYYFRIFSDYIGVEKRDTLTIKR